MAAESAPLHVLCYHVLLAAACTAGRKMGNGARELSLAPRLAEMVSAAKRANVLVGSLAEVRDDVTDKKLVTPSVASRDHSVCCLIEDMFTLWMESSVLHARDGEYTERVATEMCAKLDLPPDTPISVADVLAYGAPLARVFVPDTAGTYPVCTDEFAAPLLKKITLLLYIVQYHAAYAQQVNQIEDIINRYMGTGNAAACWEDICAAACPTVWACLKLRTTDLLEMCANVQADTKSWRANGLDPAYNELEIPRMIGGAVPEDIENDYMDMMLTNFISTRYGAQKIMNPTTQQVVPFMRHLAVQMRMLRNLAASMHVQDVVFPGWTDVAQVPPFAVRDVVARAPGHGIVVQDAKRQRSFAVGTTRDGASFFVDGAAAPEVVPDATSINYDARVAATKSGELWRACVIMRDATAETAERASCLRALLDLRGIAQSATAAGVPDAASQPGSHLIHNV